MKSQKCQSPLKSLMGILEGKVGKLQLDTKSCKGNDATQMVSYLNKLQHMVPFCPKDRSVSKLQLIESVIDYIYDLQNVLEDTQDIDKISISSDEGDSGIEDQETSFVDRSPTKTSSGFYGDSLKKGELDQAPF